MNHWECRECDHGVHADTAPEACPCCGERGWALSHVARVDLDGIDRRLLSALAQACLLTLRPYRVLAAAAGIAEEDAIARIRRLQAGPVRQIGGVFDPCLLGYRSAALLMECAPSGAAEFAEASSRHPWVVRTSLCDPSGTVWLWLALPDNADLQWEAERLAGLQPVRSMVVMPIAAVYRAPVERRGAPPAQWREIEPHGQVESLPTEFERRAIRVLQRDLPLSEWAFDDLAARVGCGLTARGLVRVGREFMARGWLRRYGAVMRLPRRGEEVSAIGAWRVPDTGASSVAARIARVPGVVEAAVLEGCSCWWPYNIVAEVDGHNTAECGSILKAASAVAPDCPRTSVAEVQDLKRARPRFYFREPTAA